MTDPPRFDADSAPGRTTPGGTGRSESTTGEPQTSGTASASSAAGGTASGGGPSGGGSAGGGSAGGTASGSSQAGGTAAGGTDAGGAAGGKTAAGNGAAGRGPGRRPGPTETREKILAAARDLFAEKGYDGASLRAIARAAGVDPALVHHFYGNKEGVFVEAMRFPVDPSVLLPRVATFPRERFGELMVRTFLEVWGDDERRRPLLAMLRSAMTNERAAALLREFITSALFARAGQVTGAPQLRIQAAAGQMIGLMILRYVVRVEPMASASEDELIELAAPTIQRYLVP